SPYCPLSPDGLPAAWPVPSQASIRDEGSSGRVRRIVRWLTAPGTRRRCSRRESISGAAPVTVRHRCCKRRPKTNLWIVAPDLIRSYHVFHGRTGRGPPSMADALAAVVGAPPGGDSDASGIGEVESAAGRLGGV